MRKITVNASRRYDIIISSGILENVGNYVAQIHKACKVLIITDTNVGPIYADIVKTSLENTGFEAVIFTFEAGEERKNISTLGAIWNKLALERFTRSDLIVALGGGVCGDLSGFAAASFLRGMEFIQIPTSLLAMTDSSVGGKTAIDLEYGKNLVGAFHQPSLVICDAKTLETLPNHYFSDGMAEVIKYGMINRRDLLDILCGDYDIEDIIEICVDDKRQIVEIDEHDNSARKLLNFGHTFGHAIEKLSDFRISHGFAVAMGMRLITKASETMKIAPQGTYDTLSKALSRFNLCDKCEFDAKDIAKAASLDKKCLGEKISLVLPYDAGDCRLFDTDISQLEKYIKAGLE